MSDKHESNSHNTAHSNSAVDIVLESLARFGGRQKPGSTYRLICCPFHSESNPSLSVNISKPGLAVGTFNCWSCPASGNWNKLAEKCGFPLIKKWQNGEQSVLGLTEAEEQEMLGFKSEKDFATSLNVEIISDWRPNKEWRGFSGKLLSKLKAKLVIDRTTDEPFLLLPVSVNKKLVGYVKAALEKRKGQLPYISSKGEWIKDKGLFPYDYISKMAREKGFVVLVEGPRDALRLIVSGIPALAVFGVQNFGKKKANTAAALGVQCYIMADNDPAGAVLVTKAKESFKKMDLKLKTITLPKKKDKQGKLIKLDPQNVSQDYIDTLLERLEELHSNDN
jgi:5S rRNA maturation endonuclease (ribonuclease M5)